MQQSDRKKYVLTVSCPEANGIVRAVSDFLFQREATITDAAQHRDREIDQFFMRVQFEESRSGLPGKEALAHDFLQLGKQFAMQWEFFDLARKTRSLLAVFRHTHCLNDILHRWGSGVLPAEAVGVVSNHRDMEKMTEWYGLPYAVYADTVTGNV